MGEPTLDTAALELERQKLELERQKLDLERYKVGRKFWRTIIVGGLVALAIAAVPAGFQYATSLVDKAKFDYQLDLDKAKFRSTYVSGFLDKGLNQDIEVRLRLAEYFKFLAQDDKNDKKAWESYYEELKNKRETVQRTVDDMERELAKMQDLPKASRDYVAEDRLVEKIRWRRDEVGYVAPNRSVLRDPRLPESAAAAATINTSTPIGCGNPSARINLDAKVIPAGRRDMAELIASAFAKEGYGVCQQAAAVAAAINWSRLDPRAMPAGGVLPEVGLYQLNPGLRFGTAEQLRDPTYNTAQIIKAAGDVPSFKSAATLPDAVAIFVRRIMIPPPGLERIADQISWAQQLVE